MPMSSKTRVRIAPSPTGPIHVGTLHTALFNWLFARNLGGQFILRLEDTDQERSRPEWVHHIYNELKWIGIDWDEGPDIGGPYGPYTQSEPLGLYQQDAERLLKDGQAYYSYCTPEELEPEREAAVKAGVAYQYSRKCLSRPTEETARMKREGRVPCIRLKIPSREQVVIKDLIRGPISISTATIGDPVIVRPNGVSLYNFAVIVDDIQMGITHVIRGEEHISNTPVQLLIAKALKVEPPAYAHLGLLLNPDRTKMSKRRGDAFAGWYRENGYLPEALLNFLALLGWTPSNEREVLSVDEMIAGFSLDRVAKAGAVFDRQKLDWMNGQYIRQMPVEELVKRILAYLSEQTELEVQAIPAEDFIRIVALIQERILTLADVPDQVQFFFRDEPPAPELCTEWFTTANLSGVAKVRAALVALESFTNDAVEQTCRALAQDSNLKPKQLFQTLRLSITGRLVSPPLFESLSILGKSRTLQRLDAVLKDQALPGEGNSWTERPRKTGR